MVSSTYFKDVGHKFGFFDSDDRVIGLEHLGSYHVLGWIFPVLMMIIGCASPSSPIVFTSDRDGNSEIYSIDVDTRIERNITDSPTDELSPRVSPDGNLIAFQSGKDPNLALETIAMDGTDRSMLTIGVGKNRGHRWSPGSDRIAYIKDSGVDRSILVVNVDGTDSTKLTSIHGDEVGNWSPDGNSVLFSVHTGEGKGVYKRNPNGVNEFQLTFNPDFSPLWSPNSDRIAFLSEREGDLDIYVISIEGEVENRLTKTDGSEYDLSWSPDSKRLLFVSERDGNAAEIYVIELESEQETQLTHNTFMDVQPVWSPSGEQIAFVSYLDGDAEIFVMNSDGSNQVRLTSNLAKDTSPSW